MCFELREMKCGENLQDDGGKRRRWPLEDRSGRREQKGLSVNTGGDQ